MIRKMLMMLSTTIILATIFSIPRVYAKSVSNSEDQLTQIKGDSSGLQNDRLTTDQEQIRNQSEFQSDHLKRVNQAIHDNNRLLEKADLDFKAAKTNTKKLKSEIKVLEDSIKKRNQVLKDRALSYQHSRGNVPYLEVLLGSSSFSDFFERVGAVATIVDADRNLLQQQETAKKDYEDKKVTLDSKLARLTSMKTDLEGMRAHLKDQQEMINKQHEKNNRDQLALKTQSPKKDSDFSLTKENMKSITDKTIKTIITAGFKYIGNSVYLFGGGRNTYDIQNGRFDCSGFVHWAFAQGDIDVGSSTDSLKNSGKQVSVNEMQPGDLVFFDTYKKDGHVGIYLGDGKFIGSQSSTGVAIADMTKGYWKETFHGRVIRI